MHLPAQAQDYSAKKLYRVYKKKEGFKEVKMPRFLLAAARLIVKDDNANTVLKAFQKARVIGKTDVTNIKQNQAQYKVMSSSLNDQKYKPVSRENSNILDINVRKNKRNKIKEMTVLTNAGGGLYYVLVKGKMKQEEVDKFVRMADKANVDVNKLKDQLFEGLEQLLNEF